MSQVSSTTNSSSNQAFGSNNVLNELDMNSFLDLMIAELQNQDPLDPMENDQLIAQIGQIREIGSTEQLSETLESVLLGQNIASATNLIGADVVAMTDAGQRVSGNVQRVSIDNGQPKLDLAVAPTGTASDVQGDVEEGNYRYQVVWEGSDGNEYSFEMQVATSSFEQFNGSIQVNNLPETSGPKRIYRTDSSGDGDLKLVGTTRDGTTTRFTDTTPNSNLGSKLDTQPQLLSLANRVTVTLNNIAQIEPPTQ